MLDCRSYDVLPRHSPVMRATSPLVGMARRGMGLHIQSSKVEIVYMLRGVGIASANGRKFEKK